MRAANYIDPPVKSILDVGCNAGAWLSECATLYPTARLAGVEINPSGLEYARRNAPTAELHQAGAEKLPFPDASFDCVTCMEVLEHLPADLRPAAFREMRRVLRPGGRLILSVPHAGWFAWMDSNNVRHRLPWLYRRFIGRGKRDAGYVDGQVEWHYHFTLAELERLAGDGWRKAAVCYGGLFLFPLMDWLSWPFYRLGRPDHFLRRFFERVGNWDYRHSYGNASYGILLALERVDS